MTTQEFRQRVKLLHPDLNGGDTSTLDEFRKLLAEKEKFDLENRLCKCGCGRKLPAYKNKMRAYSIKVNQNVRVDSGLFFNRVCWMRHTYYRKTLSK